MLLAGLGLLELPQDALLGLLLEPPLERLVVLVSVHLAVLQVQGSGALLVVLLALLQAVLLALLLGQ